MTSTTAARASRRHFKWCDLHLRRWNGIDNQVRLFEKIVCLGAPADIEIVWISGRFVAARDELVTD